MLVPDSEACGDTEPAMEQPQPKRPCPDAKGSVLALRGMQFYCPMLPEQQQQQVQQQQVQQQQQCQEAFPEKSQTALYASVAPPKQFKSQQEAFDYIDQRPESLRQSLRVFAEEVAESGCRRFIVATPERMWTEYEQLAKGVRHYYEIIRQGHPCHLYFDLEYQPACNPGLDGEAMVSGVLTVVGALFQELFHFQLQHDWVLELDSSTPTKFSRHLIIRIKRAAFANYTHVGAFVAKVIERVQQRGQVEPLFAAFWVRKATGTGVKAQPQHCLSPDAELQAQVQQEQQQVQYEQVQEQQAQAQQQPQEQQALEAQPPAQDLFIDTAVYTRNRAFRLYLSSKFGKTAVLLPTNRFGFHSLVCKALGASPCVNVPDVLPDKVQKAVFLATLITNTDPGCKLLQVPGASERPLGGPRPGQTSAAHCAPAAAPTAAQPVPCDVLRFPLLADFVHSVCNQDGAQGCIRSCLHQPETGMLLVNIKGNRWCGNVGMQHKSNGIYFMVDLVAGTWHQRCYDPCCRSFRSVAMPLPMTLWNSLKPLQPTCQQADSSSPEELDDDKRAPVACAGDDDDDDFFCQAMDAFEQQQQAALHSGVG